MRRRVDRFCSCSLHILHRQTLRRRLRSRHVRQIFHLDRLRRSLPFSGNTGFLATSPTVNTTLTGAEYRSHPPPSVSLSSMSPSSSIPLPGSQSKAAGNLNPRSGGQGNLILRKQLMGELSPPDQATLSHVLWDVCSFRRASQASGGRVLCWTG
jgi:hypothetical protein